MGPTGRFRRPGGRPGRPGHVLPPGGTVPLGDGTPRRPGTPGRRHLVLRRHGRLADRHAGGLGPDRADASAGPAHLHRAGPQGGPVVGHCLQAQVPAGPAGERPRPRRRDMDHQAPGTIPGPVRGDSPQHAGAPPVSERPQGAAGQVPGDTPGVRGGPLERAGENRVDGTRVRVRNQGGTARRGCFGAGAAGISVVDPVVVERPVKWNTETKCGVECCGVVWCGVVWS
mmetsp:Transcript_22620/g.62964  ORF Transcript_22620/g.62964 Transcript_22620/m.62964 type:complete len:228 (-) Transcript_22620:317-1000(-)